jgi:three-Cys-motif partner protein
VILSTLKKYPHLDQKMAYIDLFAGPGRYDDQSKSTPLLVLETIISIPDLRSRMLTYFNDKDRANIDRLEKEISKLDGIDSLKYSPVFINDEVGDEFAKFFDESHLVPSFFFVDPWGYKGLSLNLVSSMIKDWGCDCVFFFNYNRINMGISNDAIKPHLVSLFGEKGLNSLRNKIEKIESPNAREILLVEELCNTLKNNSSRFVLPFRFKNENGNRTSHHLIFISKNFLGYDIMKTIMYKESSNLTDNVASFEYNPRDMHNVQGSLFDLLSRPLDDLQDMLLQEYAGQTIDFIKLYKEHSVDKPYVQKNYRDVLINLFDKGLISAKNPNNDKPPRKKSFSEDMRITFRGLP